MKTIDKYILKELNPCADRWKNFLNHYSDWSGDLLEFTELDKITIEDKLWVLLKEGILDAPVLHELACRFAESFLDNFEKEYPSDKRPRQAIEAKRKWLTGEISDEELSKAREAAWSAARSAREAAWYAAGSAAESAAESTGYAAGSAGASATAGSARSARAAARSAAWSARSAAESTGYAAGSAEQDKQLGIVKELLGDIRGNY